jgi:DNA-binding transcriptional MerR regulator|tara:strand:+ start:235 stop:813 length:579 start_codon:yes stop_codon:yes gene_type:complete
VNIGEVVKKLQIKHPSVTISRIRFLEKEGLVNIKRSPGGTRKFSNKDIEKISKIIYLQEIEFYSLKAIKNNPSLLKSNKSKSITIDSYSLRDLLKQAGISKGQYNELISFGFEDEKDEYSNNDLNRLKSWSYFYSIGLEPKNFSVLKSINQRSVDFVEFINSLLPDDSSAEKNIIINNYSNLIRSYLLKNNL